MVSLEQRLKYFQTSNFLIENFVVERIPWWPVNINFSSLENFTLNHQGILKKMILHNKIRVKLIYFFVALDTNILEHKAQISSLSLKRRILQKSGFLCESGHI